MVAGCGGSKSTSTSSTSATPITVPPITTTGHTAGTQTTVTLTPTTTQTATKTTASTPTGSINVRVPARFTILPNGAVRPPTVTIPADLPVELIVIGDAQAHRIKLRTTTFTIGAHEQIEKLIDGLKAGTYPLQVDGAPKAVLTIGGEPGP